MPKPHIHQEIWMDIRGPIKALIGHFIVLVSIFLVFWAIIEITEMLFSDQHIIIRMIIYISDISIMIHFAEYALRSLLHD
jgi:cytochrome c oxidase assembly factor CtaG